MENNLNFTPNQGIGLNTESDNSQLRVGQLTFALNAIISSFDGNEVVIQNEEANKKCLEFPQGYKAVGVFSITEINRVVYFLHNSQTGDNEIGYTDNDDCTYTTLLNSPCLNFRLDSPILQLVSKITNCGHSIYWTDNNNSMRYIDFEDLPWVEIPDPTNDYQKIKLEGQVDCNKMLVQPLFAIPQAQIEGVVEGGNLKTGSYQFVVQYANEIGESYTAFYNPTNTISINEPDRATQIFDLETNKAITVKVSGLDNTGIFDYFNLVVIETVNAISTNRLVGTYPIADTDYTITYGGNAEAIQISALELFQKFQHYDLAEGVTTSDDRIIWYGLKSKQRQNYQPIWSKVLIDWETVKIPYNKNEGYYNPINILDYRGYMRDEVYPLEGCFILKGGRQSDSFHIPGRLPKSYDLTVENSSNKDTLSAKNNECDTEVKNKVKWQVYNTGSVKDFSEGYEPNNSCYKGPYQYGEMSYWESEETYPNNKDIWGDLAAQPIRHHKFPDELITPRFSKEGDKYFIYPIGFKVDIDSLKSAIKDSDLSQEEQDDIIGFKIFRGDRSSGNMSVKAKGHFSNVGKYSYQEREYYFANYPYNSLKADPLFAKTEIKNHTQYNPGLANKPFEDEQGKDQFVFHSPDTHFGRVGNIDTGYIKFEAIDFGDGVGHFTKVRNNAEYKFTTQRVTMTAAVLATGVAFDVSRKGNIEFNGSDFAQVYNNTTELLEKLIPYENMGYNINSIANFDNSIAVPNTGWKVRTIDTGKYLNDGYNTIEDGKLINNFRRESSVYIHTDDVLKYAHEYNNLIPEDNSRFIYSTADTDAEDDLTDEQYWELFKTTEPNAAIALIYGLFASAAELGDGSENLRLVLVQYLTNLIQYYLTQPYSEFQTLQNIEDACTDYTTVYDEQPFSTLTWETLQNSLVRDSSGEILLDHVVGDGTATIRIDNEVAYLKPNEEVVFNYVLDEFTLTPAQDASITSCNRDDFSDESAYLACQSIRGILGGGVYGRPQFKVCGAEVLKALYNVFEYAKSGYKQLDRPATDETLSMERGFKANAYYGALKEYLPTQWGRMYSYQTVDTGYYSNIDTEDKSATIFGGDTFINQFSFKTKLPVYTTNLVGEFDQKDVALDEDGNLGNPMFYISTKPDSFDYNISETDLATSFEGIGVKVKTKAAGSLLQTIGTAVMAVGAGLSLTVVGSIAGVIVAAVGGILYVVGSIFSNIGSKVTKAIIRIYKDLLKQIIENYGVKNINLDNGRSNSIKESGLFYQYVYGIPTYFVESQVNVDYRQATNDNEGNFFPRVGEAIPDDWLQEDRVPIINDNNYTYNKSFSKQNKESSISHLPETYDPNKICNTEFQNRAFWSEKSNLNENLNNWLIYKPASRFDFPKSFGKLTSLDGVLNRQVIARFVNKTQIYNALTALATNNPTTVYLGNSQLFTSTPPIDLSETNTGSLGSQHKFLLKTPRGIVYTNSKAGQIILLNGTTPTIISDFGMSKWFKQYLPFKNIEDNHLNGYGLTGVYDEFYDRLIITKKDEKPWTLSFSFKTKTWTSWHSYTPNFYVPFPNYFQSSNNDGSVWNHNQEYTRFNNFYDKQHEYIVEYPFVFKDRDEIIQSFKDYTVAFRYEDIDTPVEEENPIYFNKAILYNNNQYTGVLNLIPNDVDDLSFYSKYPQYNELSKDILLHKFDHYYGFNDIVDITKNKNKALFVSNSDPIKRNLLVDETNLNFGEPSYNTPMLRAKDARVRLILDDKSNYKLLSRINILQTQQSIR